MSKNDAKLNIIQLLYQRCMNWLSLHPQNIYHNDYAHNYIYTKRHFSTIEYVKVVDDRLIFKVPNNEETILLPYTVDVASLQNIYCEYCGKQGYFYITQINVIFNSVSRVTICNKCNKKIIRMRKSQLPKNKFIVQLSLSVENYVNCSSPLMETYKRLQRSIKIQYTKNLIVLQDVIFDVRHLIMCMMALVIVRDYL